jgi:hypothetical protein
LSPSASYAALWLAAGTTIGIGRAAHAAGESGAPSVPLAAAEPPAPIAWGLRFTTSAGWAFGTDTFGWTFTTGITMGFDVARP